MDISYSLRGSATAIASVLLFGAQAAAAQDSDSQAEPAANTNVIIVTAEKGAARTLTETPISINVVDGAAIDERGINSLSQVLNSTPGLVTAELIQGSPTFTLRGISAISGDPTTGLYLDEVPFFVPPLNIAPDVGPYDLERVEVLRGPQGTLYGAGAMGGVIRVLTKKPDTMDFGISATGGVSFVDGGDIGYKAQGYLNVPIVEDKLAVRLVGSYVESPGYIDLTLSGENNFNTSTNENYRAKIIWTPTQDVELGASYWHSRIDSFASYSDQNYNFAAKNDILDFFALAVGQLVDVGDRTVPASELANFVEYDFYTLYGSYTADKLSIYLTGTYGEIDADTGGSRTASTPIFFRQEGFETRSVEGRVSYTEEGRYGATVGGFYLKSSGQTIFGNMTFTNFPGFEQIDTTLAIITPRISEQFATFGELHYYIIPDVLRVTAGLRYFEDKRTEGDTAGTPIADLLTAVNVPLIRTEKFDKVTKRLNISFTPSPKQNFYFNYAEGFRSGNVQCGACAAGALQDGFPLLTDPDNLKSYEVGAKIITLGRDLSIDAAAYYWKWKDIGIALNTVLMPPFGLGPSAFFANAGSAESYGFDLGLTYTGIDNVVLNFTGNLNDNKYLSDLPAAALFRGSKVNLASEYNFSASGSWRDEISPNVDGFANVSFTLLGPISTYTIFGPPAASDTVKTVDLQFGIEHGPMRVSFYANNLLNTNDISFNYADALALGGGPLYQRPRTVGMDFTLTY